MQEKKRTIKVIIFIIAIILLMITSHVNAQSLTIKTETLMLRKEATTESAILELLSEGEKYEIVGEEGNWYKIQTKEHTGYVNKDYVVAEGASKTEENNTVSDNSQIEPPQNEQEPENEPEPEPEPEPKTEEPEEQPKVQEKMRVSQNTKLRVLPLVQAIVLEELQNDAEVTIINTCNKWAFVETETQTGWVRIDMLAPAGAEQDISNYDNNQKPEDTQEPNNEPQEINKKGYISGTGVNVRSEASTQAKVVEVLNTNAEVTVLSQEGEWYKIRYTDVEGYVLAKFVSETEV